MNLLQIAAVAGLTAVLTWQFARVRSLHERNKLYRDFAAELTKENERWIELLEQHEAVSIVGEVVSVDRLPSSDVLMLRATSFPESWEGERVVVYRVGTSPLSPVAPDTSD